MSFVKVAEAADVAVGTAKCVRVNGREFAIFNLDGEFHCTDNDCPHAGGPLADGSVDRDAVMCPWHCWWFNIKTGEGLYGLGIGIGTHPCKVEDGSVLIDV